MKISLAALFLPILASAAILPDNIGSYHRASMAPATPADRALWEEYGLKESETARYENGAQKFTAAAYRLRETTGAMAAYDWQRPANAKPSKAAGMAAETVDTLLVLDGNFLFSFSGYKPSGEELAAVFQSLHNVDTSPLPVLPGYLPAEGLVANSERYVTGPGGLQKFDPAISPSVAAFRYGAEAQIGVFHSRKGDMTLAIFNYPDHQIARERVAEFEKLPGAAAKRSGPLVAVVLAPADPDFAERLLAGIRFQAEVTADEYVPTRRDNVGSLLLNAFILIGILIAFSVVSGLALGGFRAAMRRGHHGEEADAMISLHLEQR